MHTLLKIDFYGKTITCEKGAQISDIIQTHASKEVLEKSFGAVFDDTIVDWSEKLSREGTLRLLDFEKEEGKRLFWHSTAHLMAEALLSVYPGIRFGIGPPIEQGFYYDIDFGDHPFNEKDFKRVEEQMRRLAKQSSVFRREVVGAEKALQYYKAQDNPYKLELIEELAHRGAEITFYHQGNFTDLCKGPHVKDTGVLKAVKLLGLAGAYWRGDEKRKQLTRIYGISFPTQEELKEFLRLREEAKQYDHRRWGKKLGLFTFSTRVGVGLPLWDAHGATLLGLLESFLRKQQILAGYHHVRTPHIGHKQLYDTSGHYAKYKESSFSPMVTPQGEEFLLKPMNCPHHCELFAHAPRSYRDLPYRMAEFGTVYRYEQSGELHGLTRVRGFTQDDAHIFCTHAQVKAEFKQVIRLMKEVFKALGFSRYEAQLSFRDKHQRSQYIGDSKDWDLAEAAILSSTAEEGVEAKVVYGEAAFYGPKLDFMVKDALQRRWQLGTIQIDYQLPKRFSLAYVGKDNQKHQPVILHRALFGSMERFIALLLEHCKGELPWWLSPVQISVVHVSEKAWSYAKEVYEALKQQEYRVYWDEEDGRVGKKIREAETQRIPLVMVIGERERDENRVSLRVKNKGDEGMMDIPTFISRYDEVLRIPV